MVSYLLLATIQVLAINCPWVAALGWKFPPTVKVDLHKGSKEIKHAIELGHDPLEAAVDGITMGLQGDPRPKNTATSLRPQSTSSNFVTTSSRLHGTASSPRVEERAATATSPSPTPVMTVAPDCGRAQVFLVACMEYWSSESVTEATDQAHCLCYGPANDMSSGIVYVPELFDQDAEACASFYSYSVSGSPEWATTLADDWSEVTGFCAQNGPAENEGIHTEGPEYFAKQVALAAPTGDATSDGGREVALEERQSSESRAAMLNIGFAPLLASVSWLLIYFMVI